MQPPDRAVVVALRGDDLLVIRRHKDGRRYSVLPGGGVESGESPRGAALRELHEETGRDGRVISQLRILSDEDRTAHYFLVDVRDGPLIVGGPETDRQSPDNSYDPAWVPMADLEAENLQPAPLRDQLRRFVERQHVPGGR